jgi:hypothetical protein
MTKQYQDRGQGRKTQRQMAAEGEALRLEEFGRLSKKRMARDPKLAAVFARSLTGDGAMGADYYRHLLEQYIAEHQLDGTVLRAELEGVLATVTCDLRAVMMVTLRVDLYGLISSSLAPLAKGSMVMVTGGDYTTEFLEVTVPGTERRICVMRYEVSWDELLVGDSVLREQLDRNLAYYDAWREHPQHKQELMRRRARIVRDMHGQYAAPSFQLAIFHEGRDA